MTSRRPQNESELVDLVRGIDVPAPPELHARVAALLDEHRRRPRLVTPALARRRLLAPGIAAVAAGILAAVLATGGGASAPTLSEAAALTRAAPTLAAPREDPVHRSRLLAAADGVSFPYWGEQFGWKAVGARSDRLHGRPVKTVFYADPNGRRVGYAIVAGSAPAIGGGTIHWRQGTPFHVISAGGATEVAWLRHGHLCVVSGRSVSPATLLALASWKEAGERA